MTDDELRLLLQTQNETIKIMGERLDAQSESIANLRRCVELLAAEKPVDDADWWKRDA